ncbi:MAG: dicarboxylate/amino acid:cation symporter [Clostridiales bacterium]|nr:dicarboxylate/amino acid:cation symporter [Clostridiales bacterium]
MSEAIADTKKRIRIGLVPRLLIAIGVGVLLGSFAPEPINRFVVTLSALFGSFLGFIIPLMILAFVTMGIAELSQGAGKLLILTVVLAYTSTLLAGGGAFLVATNVFPNFVDMSASAAGADMSEGMLSPYFSITLVPIMDVMAAIIMAFILGICISMMRAKSKTGVVLHSVFGEFLQVINFVLMKIIVPLLPIFICGTFVNMTVSGAAFTILNVLWRVFLVVIIMHFVYLLIVYNIGGFASHKNPFALMKKQVPAYVTALGTQSSAATIPVNLKCAESQGVPKEIVNFLVPLCANIHLPGSIITITSCVTAVLLMNGMPVSPELFLPFILTLSVVMVAAPGAPGGAVMAALPFFPMVGIASDSAMASIIIAFHLAQDGFGTACNVSGDNALANIVGAYYKKRVDKGGIAGIEGS